MGDRTGVRDIDEQIYPGQEDPRDTMLGQIGSPGVHRQVAVVVDGQDQGEYDDQGGG